MIRKQKNHFKCAVTNRLTRHRDTNGRLRHPGTTTDIGGTFRADQPGTGAHRYCWRIHRMIKMRMHHQHRIKPVNLILTQHRINAFVVRGETLRHHRKPGSAAEIGIGNQPGNAIGNQQRRGAKPGHRQSVGFSQIGSRPLWPAAAVRAPGKKRPQQRTQNQ